MANPLQKFIGNETARHYVRVVAFAVLGISVGAFLALSANVFFAPEIVMAPEVVEEGSGAVATATAPYPRSAPIHIRIPSVGIDADFEAPLGLNDDQTIEVPDSFEKVGWYKLGASPGENGPAVILGHVDSYEGPAVFYKLGKLSPGDSVFITRADGTEVEFQVDYFERYPIEEFPTEKVYGMTTSPELRLITCTGVYDHGTLRYNKNLVVYGKLVTPGE